MSTAPRSRRSANASTDEATAEGEIKAEIPAGTRVIKKYPNRRLYDTQTSSYITLVDVKEMVMACEHFMVIDAKSGEDLTRSILLQIILEEETGGVPMFSTQALAQIIRFYGHTMQGMMGNYLEKNIQSFIDLQSKLAENSVVAIPNPVQGFMTSYMEQSRQMFTQMQDQMTKQAESLIGNLGSAIVPPGKK
jgi:polyhydroxyalkanoate synthesis repressor PhaR